jgi:hypothetical protein
MHMCESVRAKEREDERERECVCVCVRVSLLTTHGLPSEVWIYIVCLCVYVCIYTCQKRVSRIMYLLTYFRIG